jgi:hypothetical protein
LLADYRDASWSPKGKFIAAIANGRTLVALEPDGDVHWEKPQRQPLSSPRWSFEGFRIAYFAGRTLRVIVGNSTGDRLIGPADPSVPPAWRPGTHELAYVTRGGTRVVDVDTRKTLRVRPADLKRLHAAVRPGGGPAARIESRRGRSVVLVGARQVFSGTGLLGMPAWAPGGRWLAVNWPSADQMVFIRIVGRPKLIAVSGVARQFGAAPNISGWSR